MYTTNYQNTFIQIADDCDSKKGIVPPNKKIITIANIQYELIINNSYRFTSDDILFICYLKKNGINFEYVNDKNSITERENFFLKNKPCLRTSPLPKKYG